MPDTDTPEVTEARQQLRNAQADFRAATFQHWSRGNEVWMEECRSRVGFWRGKLRAAIAAQAEAQATATTSAQETSHV